LQNRLKEGVMSDRDSASWIYAMDDAALIEGHKVLLKV
jgi:hypothetical protein